MRSTLRIGTRGSALAMTQARWVAQRLKHDKPEIPVDIIAIKTKGDIMQDVSLAKIGGKGLFVKEIEDALLRGEIDIAVHSMKDVPVELPEGLEIGIMSEREDPRDVLISKDGRRIEDMPQGARIGTGSLRRTIQLRYLIPGVEVIPLRGNLDTRIRKIRTDNLDGIIVAAAGMKRMGWSRKITQVIPVDMMLPPAGQGVLGIELREDDIDTRNAVSPINHPQTWLEVTAERTFLKRLGGGCQLPVASYGKKTDNDLTLTGFLGSLDGRILIRDEVRGPCESAEALGVLLAERILSRGGEDILKEVYKTHSF
ncbi:MAG: hydroxymethylbilane synthase [Deltaproteobacteria bacterium]|nr:hydroxymethylbilane synthase [Deltaproteobacteria bacterium]